MIGNACLSRSATGRPEYVVPPEFVIVEGTERTRREVQQTVFDARKAMGLTGVYTQIRRKAERSRKTSATA